MVLAALLTGGGCTGRYTHIEDDRFEVDYDLPDGTREVRLELVQGAITFRPGAAGVVRIEAIARRASDDAEGLAALEALDLRPVAAELPEEPGVLVLRGPRLPPGTKHPDQLIVLRCVVEVPAEVAVVGLSQSGHLGALGRRGDVRLESGHGSLRLDDCQGDAVLRTARGAIMIDKHRGSLDVELAVVGGKRIAERDQRKGETLQVYVDEIGAKGLRIVAPHASVQCHVPADASFVLDVRTHAGRGKNGFGIPIVPLEGSKFGTEMRGTVGAGGPPLHIAVDFGNVSVRARKHE